MYLHLSGTQKYKLLLQSGDGLIDCGTETNTEAGSVSDTENSSSSRSEEGADWDWRNVENNVRTIPFNPGIVKDLLNNIFLRNRIELAVLNKFWVIFMILLCWILTDEQMKTGLTLSEIIMLIHGLM